MSATDFIQRNRSILGVSAAVGLVLLLFVAGQLFSTPQIGVSDDVFRTVDSLFTALTSHDNRRLEDCEQRLHTYREHGQLSGPAAKRLDAIIGEARSGEWQRSARRLYDFMLAQRRTA